MKKSIFIFGAIFAVVALRSAVAEELTSGMTFELSSASRSSYPQINIKRIFEADVYFMNRSCYIWMNSLSSPSQWQARTIAAQCQSNLNRLDEYLVVASEFLMEGCTPNGRRVNDFDEVSTRVLCEGFLEDGFIPNIEDAKQQFESYRIELKNFAARCELRTGDAIGC